MPDILRPLVDWLNASENRSHLNIKDRQSILKIIELGYLHFSIEAFLESLRNAAHLEDVDSLRKAEILLWCAAIGHSRGSCPQAARDARAAAECYDTDYHRRAVALWMSGSIQWEMRRNHDAHENWIEARNIFKDCRDSSQPSADAINWYKDPVWQMEVELVARPEEIRTWLNPEIFELSSLRQDTAPIVHTAQDKIRQAAYPNMFALVADLQRALGKSQGRYEMAEIQFEFGLGAYQMGNQNFAIDLLRKAVQNFSPGIGTYHKQVVARCMLGALEWMDISSNKQAAADWQLCIKEFETLQWLADRDNSPEQEEWYSEHCGFLRSALLDWVEPSKQSDPRKQKNQ